MRLSKLAILAIIAQFLLITCAWAASTVVVLHIKGPIGPATLDYFSEGLNQAIGEQADAVLLTLDTPGGLESSMREINNLILSSPIPIISYVAPTGARAMSAGTYIMYASHLAFMAEGTTMGAATPITLNMPYTQKTLDAEQKKIMQDASAYIKTLANLRGRNADWAVDAVVNAVAITASDAKRLNVITDIANDETSVLKMSNGHSVDVHGQIKTITLDNPTLEVIEPDWRFDLLTWITDPNIAYLLLLLAIYAIVVELMHPGIILPGIIGVVSLIVALYAFQLMPLNYAGFSLLLTGAACLLAEIFISSFGALAIIGLIAFVAGSLMLFDTSQPEYQVALSLIISMTVITGIFFLFLLNYLIKAQRRIVVTGQEGLLQKEGIVISNHDGKLLVKIMGEQWNARSTEDLQSGTLVKVVAVDGIILTVTPIKHNGE